MTNRALFAAAALLMACGSALALPPDGVLSGPLAAPVRNIPMADQIDGWLPIDNQHVVVSLAQGDAYLITLKDQCLGLSWAQDVGVTMSNNTIWAGFDAITADGWQCPIETINPVRR